MEDEGNSSIVAYSSLKSVGIIAVQTMNVRSMTVITLVVNYIAVMSLSKFTDLMECLSHKHELITHIFLTYII